MSSAVGGRWQFGNPRSKVTVRVTRRRALHFDEAVPRYLTMSTLSAQSVWLNIRK